MHKTYLWQEEVRRPLYRIQTDDPEIARKLNRRSTCELAGLGLNIKLWIFLTSFSNPEKAREALIQLTGQKVRKDGEKGVLVAKTHPILKAKQLDMMWPDIS